MGEERGGRGGDAWDAARHGDRRTGRAPLLLTPGQLLGRAPLHTRRRGDKARIAAHLGVAAALVAATSWWVLLPHLFAGPVVVRLSRDHGVHLGDLPSLAFLAVAARSLLAVRRIAARRRPVGERRMTSR